jgi:hypothetical protein
MHTDILKIDDLSAIGQIYHLHPVFDEDDLVIKKFLAFPITCVKAAVLHNVPSDEKLFALTFRSELGPLRDNAIIRLGPDGPVMSGKKCFPNEGVAMDFFNDVEF